MTATCQWSLGHFCRSRLPKNQMFQPPNINPFSGGCMIKRVEFVEGSSSKFWQVEVVGSEVTTQWGRIGTAGQSKSKTYADEASALKDAQAQLASKLKGGYQEVGAPEKSASSPKAESDPSPSAVQNQPASTKKSTGSPKKSKSSSDTSSTPEETKVTAEAKPASPEESQESPEPFASQPEKISAGQPEFELSFFETFRPLAHPWREWGSNSAGEARHKSKNYKIWHDGLGVCLPSIRPAAKAALQALEGGAVSTDLFTNAVMLTIDAESMPLVVKACGLKGAIEAIHESSKLQQCQESHNPVRYFWVGYSQTQHNYFVAPRRHDCWLHLRRAVCQAPQDQYEELVSWARSQRPTMDLEGRCLLATVLPDLDWGAEEARACLAAATKQWSANVLPDCVWPLLASVRDPQLVLQVCTESSYMGPDPGMMSTFLANLGRGAYDIALHYRTGTVKEKWFEPLWSIPDPVLAAKLRILLDDRNLRPKLTSYYASFPHIGIPCLAEAVATGIKQKDTARTILTQLLRTGEPLPSMTTRERHVCEQLRSRFPQNQVEAQPSELPGVLVQPPWLAKKRVARSPIVVEVSLPTDFPESIEWGKSKPKGYFYNVPPPANMPNQNAEARIRSKMQKNDYPSLSDIDSLNDQQALQIWEEPHPWYEPWQGLGPLLARFELRGISGFLLYAQRNLHAVAVELQRVNSPRVASVMATALAGQKSKKIARSWFSRFPQAAVTGLIPIAVGSDKKQRPLAEDALRWVHHSFPDLDIRAVANQFGLGAGEAVQEILSFDPLQLYPNKIPALPAWLDVSGLPRPLLHNDHALPTSAVQHLCSMLAFSPIDPPYAGLEEVARACKSDSLAEFCWELYSTWHTAGGPAKDKWAFFALSHFGGDEAVRRLSPAIRVWPQEGLFARAEQGLDVLASIGTDLALMNVYQMSQKLKSKALQEKANAKMDEISARRGLTREELADRLVSDLDLEADGTCSLDFGTRQFKVVFDELLRPGLLGPDGSPVKDLPKPNSQDNAELAEAASNRWKALKKDAKTIAKGQLTRLEIAMSMRRRWDQTSWSNFLLGHPLLIHLVRRLLWGVYQQDQLVATFRVAEDSSLADAQDDTYRLGTAEDLQIGLPHPLELSKQELDKWSEVFGDYNILQPFPQLGRSIQRLTDPEKSATEITRQVGRKVHFGKLLGLEHRGWSRGQAWDSGVCVDMTKPMGAGRQAHLEFSDGLYLGMVQDSGDQTLGACFVLEGDSEAKVPLAQLDEILISELLSDLEEVR